MNHQQMIKTMVSNLLQAKVNMDKLMEQGMGEEVEKLTHDLFKPRYLVAGIVDDSERVIKRKEAKSNHDL